MGANYQSACHGKSTADVIAKLSLVEEETDESLYWMELIVEVGLLPLKKVSDLMSENTEILTLNCINQKFT
ncbi:four helix bundle protein [Nostoc punctiforme]|uniref:Four helix bundle protein n=1 Tax=Nostoc punctiforme (strain ATCC 29133 / PCC 73102) TaxID=63737 RepID=B2IU13_NOSP7|nr:four helix bundle protein [Nostoc punctiforme]ACC84301.1 hypothetical protein Npun_R6011 [Nostoc punctiforme PCC 73102]